MINIVQPQKIITILNADAQATGDWVSIFRIDDTEVNLNETIHIEVWGDAHIQVGMSQTIDDAPDTGITYTEKALASCYMRATLSRSALGLMMSCMGTNSNLESQIGTRWYVNITGSEIYKIHVYKIIG